MKTQRMLFAFSVFTAGVGIGCLWPQSAKSPATSSGKSGNAPVPLRLIPKDAAFFRISGIPEPSGLPGDLLHLRTIQDVRALRAAWRASADDPDARQALQARWTEIDPGDAIRFFAEEKGEGAGQDRALAETIAMDWQEKDPAGYLKFLAGCSGKLLNSVLRNAFPLEPFTKEFADNPGETLAVWENASTDLRVLMCEAAMGYLFAHDPERAVREAGKLPDSCSDYAWREVGNTPNPAQMVRMLEADPGIYCPDDVYERLFRKIAGEDAALAGELAADLPPGPRSRSASEGVVTALIEKNPEEALIWLESHAPTHTNRAAVGAALLPTDPERALRLIAGGEQSQKYQLESYLQRLAKSDWTAAQNLASGAPTTPLRQMLLSGMVGSLTFAEDQFFPDLEKLSSLIVNEGYRPEYLSLPDSKDSEVSGATLIGWMKNQPQAVQEQLLQAVSIRIGSGESAAVADWLASEPESNARTSALARTVTEWAASDPQAAATFSQSLPPGTDQNFAILNTALSWSRTQSAEALQWIHALPDGSAKTRALEEMQRK